MQLDISTILVMEIAASTLVAAILPVARDSRDVPGFREVGLAAVCQIFGFCLQLLRGVVTEHGAVMATAILSNALLYVALALHWCAYRLFDDPQASRRPPLAVAAACAVAFTSFWLAGAGYVPRTIATSIFLSLLAGASAFELSRAGLAEVRSRIVGIGLGALVAVCMALRVVVIALTPEVDENFLRPSLERTIAYFPSLLYTLGVGLGFLVMHRERSDARSRALALTDPMTGCLNRRALEDRVRGEVGHAVRTGRAMALIMADIDHFKHINDTHGHHTGDDVIRHVAAIFRREARTSDTVARYGGEEFCVLLRESNAAGAETMAERIRKALDNEPAETPGGATFRCTASFGIATFMPTEDEDWESLFKRADAALYRAKHQGRNRVVLG